MRYIQYNPSSTTTKTTSIFNVYLIKQNTMLCDLIKESINKTTIACFLNKAITNYTTFNNDRCTTIIAHEVGPKRITVLPINENQPMLAHETAKAHEEIVPASTQLLIVDLSLAIA